MKFTFWIFIALLVFGTVPLQTAAQSLQSPHSQQLSRTVVVLRELQGLTSAETARRLGLTVSAVKARTFHARRHLRRHLL
jgi:DNA-directed RNA polymerase specialized sigma24 family protein